MNYKFPQITNISQVLPLIKDRPEFIVAVKEGGYTVINYVVMMSDTFPPVVTEADSILRELRGMIFSTATGKPLHRRLHKFFNVNERDETQVNKIDFTEPHVILEKLDGSMLTPVLTDDGVVHWGTKMGVTQVALPVEKFVEAHPAYAALAKDEAQWDRTPIFEWCSRQQTIVIDYPVEQLVLIAIRGNTTGEYSSYEDMLAIGESYCIPVVKAYQGTADNMQSLINETKELIGAEGFVVRFDDGHMVKVKAEDYLRKHKTKESLSREKNVVELLVTEKADDVKAFMDEADLVRFNKFEKEFWDGVTATVTELVELRMTVPLDMDRKLYAVDFVQKQDPLYSRFLYAMHGFKLGDNILALVKTAIANSCGTQAKINDCRWMFNCNWAEQSVDE